ncbi:MAG TPA: hypothetical protein VG986_04610 [Pseudolabrys sp.]|nr:hypothetical protein [Pseudolabrys sp.]
MKQSTLLAIALLSIASADAARAGGLRTAEQFHGSVVAFAFEAPYSNVTLTVTGPRNFQARATSATGAPALDLQQFGTVPDGHYTYQMTGSDGEAGQAPTDLYNGRHLERAVRPQSVSISGTFLVKDGTIIPRGKAASRRDRP